MSLGVERRLAAIFSADVVGYARLMRRDEEGTLHRLRAVRAEIVDPRLAAFRGRIVKELGDGVLVEFASVVDAVRCAIDIQRAMKAHSDAEAAEARIVFRIGLNLGDVIVDGDDIQGDGVNIATRMQEVAPPGGISVSGIVLDSVRDKLAPYFEDLGPQNVKNVEEPVRAYRVMIDPEAERSGARAKPDESPGARPSPVPPARATHIPTVDGHGREGRIFGILTGVRRVGAWQVPRRLRVVSLMAGVELDFTDAEFESGAAEVEVSAIMGAVSVTVPPTIRVECDGAAFMGVFEALRQSGRDLPPDAPLLRISGLAVMGALEIAGGEA